MRVKLERSIPSRLLAAGFCCDLGLVTVRGHMTKKKDTRSCRLYARTDEVRLVARFSVQPMPSRAKRWNSQI